MLLDERKKKKKKSPNKKFKILLLNPLKFSKTHCYHQSNNQIWILEIKAMPIIVILLIMIAVSSSYICLNRFKKVITFNKIV